MTDEQIEAQITYLPLSNSNFWAVRLDSVSLGNNQIELQARHVIFDTGTSMNFIPQQDYKTLIEAITSDKDCITVSKYVVTGDFIRENLYCECSQDGYQYEFPTINLELGPLKLNFGPEFYIRWN